MNIRQPSISEHSETFGMPTFPRIPITKNLLLTVKSSDYSIIIPHNPYGFVREWGIFWTKSTIMNLW